MEVGDEFKKYLLRRSAVISEKTLSSNRKYLEDNIARLRRELNKHSSTVLIFGASRDWEEGDIFNQNQLAIRNHEASKKMLADCKVALKRMNMGIYEKCVKCGKEINEDRLIAQPQASRCRPCQEEIGLRVR